MLLAATETAVNIMMAIFGIGVFVAGLLVYVIARKLIRGDISRQRHTGMGFGIKEALASDEAWYRINRGGAKLMIGPSEALIFCGLALVLTTLIVPSLAWLVFAVSISWILLMTLLLLGYVIRVKRSEPGLHAT